MKKTLSFVLALMLICSALILGTSGTGVTVTGSEMYLSSKDLTQTVRTIELVLEINPQAPDTALGSIISTGGNGSDAYFDFQIRENGHPGIWWKPAGGKEQLIQFTQSNADVRSWGKVHLTLTVSNSTVVLYRNGEEARSRGELTMDDLSGLGKFVIGNTFDGSNRLNNIIIYSVALFSKAKTAAELNSDIKNGIDVKDPSLIAAYDFTASGSERLKDLSLNKNDLIYSGTPDPSAPTGPWIIDPWIYTKVPVTGYDYSFAVVGDTQIVSRNDILNGTHDYANLYDYILGNISSKKIKCVIGLGDIIDNYKPEEEWEKVIPVLEKLNGKVDYILSRGNHDTRSWFRAKFKYSAYAQNQLDEVYGDSPSNAYFKMTIGDIKYLIMTLDYGVEDDVLEWANGVVAANPDYNVIVATHAYLNADGSLIDDDSEYPPTMTHPDGNNGDDIWNKFVRKHKNIVLVLCGHISSNTIVTRTDKGDNGNTVVSILIDAQNLEAGSGSLGFVSFFYFSEGGRKVTVEYYSTVKKAFYLEENQFTFTLDVVGSSGTETPPEQSTPEATTSQNDTTKPDESTAPQPPASTDKGSEPAETTSTDPVTGTDPDISSDPVISTDPDGSTSSDDPVGSGGSTSDNDPVGNGSSSVTNSVSNSETDPAKATQKKGGVPVAVWIVIAVAVVAAGAGVAFALIKGKKKK